MPRKQSKTALITPEERNVGINQGGADDVATYLLPAIIESAEDAIITKTLEGVVTSWNKAAERIFGYTAEEMIGKPISLLIPPDHADEEPGILARLRRGERIEHYETIRTTKEGALINISLTVSPIKNADGIIIGASKIARDITDRKLMEERLKQALADARAAKKEAEEANRLKDEFLATISHELRTPLTSMLGWVRMLRDGRLTATGSAKALETIERNVKSQAQLVEDLLDISRIVSGKMHLNVRPTQPAPVVNGAIEAIKPAAEAKNIRLQLIVDPSTGPVFGDAERLQQVVWNLLSNAVKFTPNGGRIQVSVERVDSNVEITVTDNGKGIDPDFLPNAFSRFTQADGSTTRVFGGLGLGLAIVKSIVELHGGTVEAWSEGEGKGASFKILLPVCSDRKKFAAIHEQALEEVALISPPELAGLRILVVDDELDTCEMVSTAFEQCDAAVRIARSGAEALDLMDKWLPDVMIADIGMPLMDGYELMKQIRVRDLDAGGKVPAVALSAMARIEDRVKALSAGFQMHVAKPVELNELRTVVASLASMVNRK
jgi:PAS domain S-box-containing protein